MICKQLSQFGPGPFHQPINGFVAAPDTVRFWTPMRGLVGVCGTGMGLEKDGQP